MMDDSNKTKAELIAELELLRGETDQVTSIERSCCERLIDGLPIIIYEFDLKGRVTYANKYGLGIFGYSIEDLRTGINIEQVFTAEAYERVKKVIPKILANRNPMGDEYTALRKDGTPFPVRLFSRPITKDGRPIGVRGMVLDVSDLKLTEDALLRSESYFKTLFNSTGAAMASYRGDGIIRTCNTQFEKLSGYYADEILGKKRWMDFVEHDDLLWMMRYHKERIKEGHEAPTEYEFTFVPRDGKRKRVRLYVQVIPGTEDRVCSLIDMTSSEEAKEALRLSEERYELVVRGANDGIWDWDIDSNAVYYSPRYKSMLGYFDDEMQNTAEAWKELVHPDDVEYVMSANQACIDGEVDHFEITYRMLHKDGTYRWIHGRGAGSKDAAGRVHRLAGTHTDITSRKVTEEALLKSEERYELVVRGANDGIWDWDLETNNVYYSPRYKAMLGYENDEFPNLADSWKNAVHPEDIDYVIAANMECVEGKVDHFEVEYRLRHKDGSYRWILGRGASVKDQDGKAHRLAGTHTDITKRKEVDQALRDSEERFREIIENASDGIYQCTVQGQFLTVNPALALKLGYDSPDEMTESLRMGSHQMWVNPGDRDVFLEKLCKHGKLENYEQLIKRKDGTPIWISENVRIVKNDNDEVLFYEGFVQDITERKQHERTSNALYAISRAVSTTRDLQHLYENIHAILGQALDATNFFITIVNAEKDRLEFPYFADEKDSLYEISNISSPETKGLSVHILRTGDSIFFSQTSDIPEDILIMSGQIGSPAAAWIGVPLKHGDTIIGTMTVQSYTNPNQYTEADVALMKAVSEQTALAIERKANEEELTALNEELEYKVAMRTAELSAKAQELETANKRLTELDEVKSTLVSSVSHELRTPLTSIRGFAKLAGKDFLRHFHPMATDRVLQKKGNRIRQNLVIIEDEGERLTRLINDFLDINRIESGKATWNDVFLNPCEVILHAVNALKGAFTAKSDVELVVDLPKVVSPVHADPDKIQQVLINLLNNASKFTVQGEVRVSARMASDFLTVTVSDTGPGIPEDEQPRIFEKFHKSHTGDTVPPTSRGTGLGLTISREIVEHYGGTIWVESQVGKGSQFSFTLPTLKGSETACK